MAVCVKKKKSELGVLYGVFSYSKASQAGVEAKQQQLLARQFSSEVFPRPLDNSKYDACIMSVNATLTVQQTI